MSLSLSASSSALLNAPDNALPRSFAMPMTPRIGLARKLVTVAGNNWAIDVALSMPCSNGPTSSPSLLVIDPASNVSDLSASQTKSIRRTAAARRSLRVSGDELGDGLRHLAD